MFSPISLKKKTQKKSMSTWYKRDTIGFLLSTVSIPQNDAKIAAWPPWNLRVHTLASQTLGTFDVRPFPGPHLWQSAPRDRHSDQNTTGCSSRSPGSAAHCMDLSLMAMFFLLHLRWWKKKGLVFGESLKKSWQLKLLLASLFKHNWAEHI